MVCNCHLCRLREPARAANLHPVTAKWAMFVMETIQPHFLWIERSINFRLEYLPHSRRNQLQQHVATLGHYGLVGGRGGSFFCFFFIAVCMRVY